jgi:hypothetical protein
LILKRIPEIGNKKIQFNKKSKLEFWSFFQAKITAKQSTSMDNPLFGASPDGNTSEHIFEIKCPSKESTVENYIKGGRMKLKYLAQVSLQMKIANRKRAIFCVADPQFKINKQKATYML